MTGATIKNDWMGRAGGFSRERNARLARSLSGTNIALAGDYNQRVVLQSIRLSGTITRPQLARSTGLTMPTILNITRRLAELGLIIEAGRTEGSRGQPAARLTVNPDGCYAFGLNIDRSGVTVLLLDMTRRIRGIRRTSRPYLLPDQVVRWVAQSIEEILAEQPIDRDRIIGLGIAIPDDLGAAFFPDRPAEYAVWDETDIARRLRDVWSGAIHIDNDAAAAAMGEAQFGLGLIHRSFFYILISAGLGGSVVIDGSHFRGATGRSGELGFMASGKGTLQDTVSLSCLSARLIDAGASSVSDQAGAAIVDTWLDEAVAALVEPLSAINCLINPDAVLIAGGLDRRVAKQLVERLGARLDRLSHRIPARATMALADIYDDAAAIGAAILPFADQLLPSQASLMKRSHDVV